MPYLLALWFLDDPRDGNPRCLSFIDWRCRIGRAIVRRYYRGNTCPKGQVRKTNLIESRDVRKSFFAARLA